MEAAAAEFIESGYSNAVVSRIARRAGVTVGAIYARWPTKSDVMVAALDNIFEQLLPEYRIKHFGLTHMSTPEILELYGTYLLDFDAVQDVLTQVFGSARNNEAVKARLRQFLNDQADGLNDLIDRGRDQGPHNPELSTTAVALLCQALGIGTHLVISAGLDDRHIPSPQEWNVLLRTLLATIYPPTQPTGSDP